MIFSIRLSAFSQGKLAASLTAPPLHRAMKIRILGSMVVLFSSLVPLESTEDALALSPLRGRWREICAIDSLGLPNYKVRYKLRQDLTPASAAMIARCPALS